MHVIDTITSFVAPHTCLGCGIEGAVLCDTCKALFQITSPGRCAGCQRLSVNSRTCKSCRSWLSPYAVYVAGQYEGPYESLVRSFKFNLQRQSVRPMSDMLAAVIGSLPKDVLVCSVPTAPRRIRSRGFDHGKLLAQATARHLELPYASLLTRSTNARQLGSTRSKRLQQMEQEFSVKDPKQCKGRTILLIDDVFTTGATVSAVAKSLKVAGAKRIYVAVFAQKV